MALFTKVRAIITLSDASDYSAPHFVYEPAAYETGSVANGGFQRFRLLVDKDSTDTIAISEFASAKLLMVKNLDSTNYVTLIYNSAAGACTVIVHAGSVFMTSDVAVGTNPTLQANTADVLCEVLVAGATE